MSLNPFDSSMKEFRDMNKELLYAIERLTKKLDKLVEIQQESLDFAKRNHGSSS